MPSVVIVPRVNKKPLLTTHTVHTVAILVLDSYLTAAIDTGFVPFVHVFMRLIKT